MEEVDIFDLYDLLELAAESEVFKENVFEITEALNVVAKVCEALEDEELEMADEDWGDDD